MRSVLVLALLSAACVTTPGQKTTVMMKHQRALCQETPDGLVATLQLATERDLYLAEFQNFRTNEIRTYPARREGLTVFQTCPKGAREIVARVATPLDGAPTAPPGSAAAPSVADTF